MEVTQVVKWFLRVVFHFGTVGGIELDSEVSSEPD